MKALFLITVASLVFAACVSDAPDDLEPASALRDPTCESLRFEAAGVIDTVRMAALPTSQLVVAGDNVAAAFQRFVDNRCSSRWLTTYEAIDPPALSFADATGGTSASGCGTEARRDYQECRDACKASGKKVCGCVAALVIDVVGCF